MRSLTQAMSSISFSHTIPPIFDEEIALIGQQKPYSGSEDQDNFIIFGLSQGGIIFCSIESPDKIYTRISVHRDAIKHICEVKRNRSFISISEVNEMKIWKFGEDQRNVLQVISTYNV